MEWIANLKMKQLLNRLADYESKEELRLNVKHLNELFNPPFKKVKDCILISKKDVKELENSLDSALDIYTDKTGYEVSN